MAGYGNGGGVMQAIKAVCVAFLLVISVWFAFMGILASGEIKRHTATISASAGNHKHAMLLGRKRHSVRPKFNPIDVSKRRVPNGPDPIHNRHFGQTRRPAGRN